MLKMELRTLPFIFNVILMIIHCKADRSYNLLMKALNVQHLNISPASLEYIHHIWQLRFLAFGYIEVISDYTPMTPHASG